MKKIFSLIMAFIMCLSFGVVVSAENGPSNAYSYIAILGLEEFPVRIYSRDTNIEVKTVEGFKYDKGSNTLTITNSNKNLAIEANEMGDDFKINIVGINTLGAIIVWGFGYGGSLEIIGNGTITLNKNKVYASAIKLLAEKSAAKLKISDSVKIFAYAEAAQDKVIDIVETTVEKNAISIPSNAKVITENTKIIEEAVCYDFDQEQSFIEQNIYKKAGDNNLYSSGRHSIVDENGVSKDLGVSIERLVKTKDGRYIEVETIAEGLPELPAEYEVVFQAEVGGAYYSTFEAVINTKDKSKEYISKIYEDNKWKAQVFTPVLDADSKMITIDSKPVVQLSKTVEIAGYDGVPTGYEKSYIFTGEYDHYILGSYLEINGSSNAHTHKLTTLGVKKATYFATGYTGDQKCSSCGQIVKKGKVIAKLKLKAPKLKVKAGKKQIKVTYKKVAGATGFQVKYKLGNKKAVVKTFKSKKNAVKTIKKLKKGKYKVQIRAMIQQGKKKAYSSWAKAKTITVK